ncbi:MAG: hypothetical protein Tsb005_03670 [Gammaproteobacteria bacterium]
MNNNKQPLNNLFLLANAALASSSTTNTNPSDNSANSASDKAEEPLPSSLTTTTTITEPDQTEIVIEGPNSDNAQEINNAGNNQNDDLFKQKKQQIINAFKVAKLINYIDAENNRVDAKNDDKWLHQEIERALKILGAANSTEQYTQLVTQYFSLLSKVNRKDCSQKAAIAKAYIALFCLELDALEPRFFYYMAYVLAHSNMVEQVKPQNTLAFKKNFQNFPTDVNELLDKLKIPEESQNRKAINLLLNKNNLEPLFLLWKNKKNAYDNYNKNYSTKNAGNKQKSGTPYKYDPNCMDKEENLIYKRGTLEQNYYFLTFYNFAWELSKKFFDNKNAPQVANKISTVTQHTANNSVVPPPTKKAKTTNAEPNSTTMPNEFGFFATAIQPTQSSTGTSNNVVAPTFNNTSASEN